MILTRVKKITCLIAVISFIAIASGICSSRTEDSRRSDLNSIQNIQDSSSGLESIDGLIGEGNSLLEAVQLSFRGLRQRAYHGVRWSHDSPRFTYPRRVILVHFVYGFSGWANYPDVQYWHPDD